MCGVVDVCFVDAKEAENEENPSGKGVSEGVDCGIKETKLIGFFGIRYGCCLFDTL